MPSRSFLSVSPLMSLSEAQDVIRKHNESKISFILDINQERGDAYVLATNNKPLARLAQELVDAGIHPREYSGRGYFGKSTIAAASSARNGVSKWDIADCFRRAGLSPNEDSLGLGQVLYSKVKVDNIEWKFS